MSEQLRSVDRCCVAGCCSVGEGVPAAGDSVADGARAGVSVLSGNKLSDDSGAPASDGIAKVRGLSGGDEVPRVDADTEGFVTAVLPYCAVDELAFDQEREPVG